MRESGPISISECLQLLTYLISLQWVGQNQRFALCTYFCVGRDGNPLIIYDRSIMRQIGCFTKARAHDIIIFIWPHRITASPPDSQSEGRGSIPRGAANILVLHRRKFHWKSPSWEIFAFWALFCSGFLWCLSTLCFPFNSWSQRTLFSLALSWLRAFFRHFYNLEQLISMWTS